MAIKRRVGALSALAASSALILAACSSSPESTETPTSTTSGAPAPVETTPSEPVTITWWHNGTEDPLLTFWADIAKEFEAANPNVTIEVEAIQNEDLQKTRIPIALSSGDAPDLFQQWGGGEMQAQVESGYLMDISASVGEELDRLGGSVAPWQSDGVTYGLPFQFGVEGIWYRPSLFEQAGIEAAPTTMTELNEAVQKLKDAGIEPIAVGAADGWPAAHWWYNFALHSCSTDVMAASGVTLDFSDPCFVTAGEELQKFLGTDPFNEGFAGTPAQTGATSSAGLVANGNAAMELMGHWNIFVMRGLTDDPDGLDADVAWFPFPAVEGSTGDPAAMLGGGDGFSCYKDAPKECVDFLKYIVSDDVQTRFADVVGGLPVAPAASAGVSDEVLVKLNEAMAGASYVQLWLDTTYGPNVGGAMNEAIEAMFNGQGAPADIPAAMQEAAANQ